MAMTAGQVQRSQALRQERRKTALSSAALSSAALSIPLLLSPAAAHAAGDAGVPSAAAAPAPARILRVVSAGGVPFVIDGEQGPSGLSIDVWRAVAERARLDYEVSRADSVEQALERVQTQDADLAIGPISVTAARARRVRFTQPYFHAGLAILSRKELHPSQVLAPFLSTSFLTAAGTLLLILALVGTLIWLAERRGNTQTFPERAAPGIGSGIWFALVTMTTVGYGDYAPRSPLGRVVAALWMLIAVVSLSSLTAGIASSLTLAKLETGSIQRAEQLRTQRVTAVRGSTGAAFARHLGARLVEAPDLDAAVKALEDGRAVAVIYDQPMLEYYLQQHPDLRLNVSAQSYRATGYAFASARGSELGDLIDSALLELTEEGRISDIAESWLGVR